MTQRRNDFQKGFWPYLLATVSGILYFLGFAGFDLWPLTFIALTPLFLIFDKKPLKGLHALSIGVTYGFVTHIGGYYWLIGMLEKFSGFPFFLCILFTFIICTYQGGQLALFFWLLSRVHKKGYSVTWMAIPAYCTVELVYPLLFLSYYCNSFYDLPLLLQITDLGGPILLTAVAVAVNGAIYELIRPRLAGQPMKWPLPLLASLSLGATLWYGVYRSDEVDARAAAAPKATIGVVQTNMGVFAKRSELAEGHRRHIEGSRKLEREKAPDLIVWPETAIQRIIRPTDKNLREKVLGKLNTPVLFGGLSTRVKEGTRRIYNTAFITDRGGNILSTYDKTFLLAFGEYLPFGETFPILYEWSPNSGRFTPGDHVNPLPFKNFRITALICYEDIIPSFVRRAVKNSDPHLLINITNDSWFGDTHEPWIHYALAKFRAVEHHRYLVRSTNTGVSAIIDPIGRTKELSGVFEEASLFGEVAMMNGATVYQYLGDWPGWLSLFCIVWFLLIKPRKKSV